MYTPGPWGFEEVEDGYDVGSDETCTAIAKVNRLSDAYLIAAAPDLLNAAEQALSDLVWIEEQDPRTNLRASILLLRAAIAKATQKEE